MDDEFMEENFEEVIDEAAIEEQLAEFDEIEESRKRAKRKLDFSKTTEVNEATSPQKDAKRRKTETANTASSSNPTTAVKQEVDKKPRGVFQSKPSASLVESIPVTSSTGERVYVTVDDEEEEEKVSMESYVQTGKLLTNSIREILARIDQKQFDERFQKDMQTPTPTADSQEALFEQKSFDNHLDLLVNKYIPKKFTDLLTNEKYNREILMWVMNFNKSEEEKIKPSTTSYANNNYQAYNGNNSKQKNNNFKKYNTDHKILLLAGPPGVGKTTLAHVIARHAKYKPIEVNASDERSSEDLKEKLNEIGTKDITDFHSGQASKYPNGKILILDEIDGVGGKEGKNYIETLLKSVYPKEKKQKKTKAGAEESADGKSESKKSSKKKYAKVTQPIICICNDHYSPVLRELRMRSHVFVFRKEHINTDRLVQRLKEICQLEKIALPNRTITELANRYEGDIRSCLNTLQFLKSHLAATVPKPLIHIEGMQSPPPNIGNTTLSTLVGDKDVRKDFFDVCNQIFFASASSSSKMTASQAASSFYSSLLSDISNEKLIEGCFENYPTVKYTDGGMLSTVECLDSTCESDVLSKFVRQTQNYSLLQYSLNTLMTYHTHCASRYKPTLQYPKMEYESSRKRKQHENIIKSFYNGLEGDIRKGVSYEAVKYDLLHFLPSIITPKIRPQSVQSLSLQEKQDLQDAIDTHISYGITYKQVFGDGKSDYEMLPEIDLLTRFKVTSAKPNSKSKEAEAASSASSSASSYSMKKLLASEIHLEKVRRKIAKKNPPKKKELQTSTSTTSEAPSTPTKEASFKMPKTPNATSPKQRRQGDVFALFKFHEGHSTAVRRPAKMNDFL